MTQAVRGPSRAPEHESPVWRALLEKRGQSPEVLRRAIVCVVRLSLVWCGDTGKQVDPVTPDNLRHFPIREASLFQCGDDTRKIAVVFKPAKCVWPARVARGSLPVIHGFRPATLAHPLQH